MLSINILVIERRKMLQFLAIGVGLIFMFVNMSFEMLYLMIIGFGMMLVMSIMFYILSLCPYFKSFDSWEEETQSRTVFYFGVFAIAMLVYYEPDSSLVAKRNMARQNLVKSVASSHMPMSKSDFDIIKK
jgi:hypothetical protein